MQLDILVFAAHPDDAELGCGGTILVHTKAGKQVGIIDLTRGELGTRGTAETRRQEAAAAAAILGVAVRDNLGFADGFFSNDATHQLAVIAKIRQYRPAIVLCNAPHDRHPDHGKAAQLVADACFLSGLTKIITTNEQGLTQTAWRPQVVYHYIQDTYIKPDFVLDISAVMEQKIAAIQAFKTQFYDPTSTEPATYISDKHFLDRNYGRALDLGKPLGFEYAEGFICRRTMGVRSLFDLC